jgi:DNA-binding NarL/FixJ family response regulator
MKPPTRKTVLLVDDSRIVRERLLALIADLPGIEVVGRAARVGEAIRKIRDLRPQIVVLDISLPDGNGLQVLEAVRKWRRSIPRIIMLTNFAHQAYRQKCLQLGAEYFFDKSAQFDQAVEVLRQISRIPSPAATKPTRRRIHRGLANQRPKSRTIRRSANVALSCV